MCPLLLDIYIMHPILSKIGKYVIHVSEVIIVHQHIQLSYITMKY